MVWPQGADLMGKPAILAVDAEPEVSAAIARGLHRRYSSGYRVMSEPNIALWYCSDVVAGRGNGHLEKLTHERGGRVCGRRRPPARLHEAVASAIGEGAMSVYFVHRYLATI